MLVPLECSLLQQRPYVGQGRSYKQGSSPIGGGKKRNDNLFLLPVSINRDPLGIFSPWYLWFLRRLPNVEWKSVENRITLYAPVERDSRVNDQRKQPNEGVPPPPPQPVPVGGRLSQFVEGQKRITNDLYVLSIISQGYRLRFASSPLYK